MKKLTDYYVLITENIVDEVLTFLNYPKNANIINHYLVFGYDDVNSKHVVRVVNSNKRTKLKWSKMKRFIENSPTREKYLSAQQQSKGYKKCWLEEKQRRELLGQNFDNLLKENEGLKRCNDIQKENISDLKDSKFKLNERIERLVTERDGLVKLAKENGLTNKQTLTDWVNSILERQKRQIGSEIRLKTEVEAYINTCQVIKNARDKYYKESLYLRDIIENTNILVSVLNERDKRLKRRNRILTIGFILSASFYLIASIF